MPATTLKWKIAEFDQALDRSHFACGEPVLDDYIQTKAGQDVRRNMCRVYMAVPEDDPQHVLGYYTLSNAEILFASLPKEIAKRLPRYGLPAARIGRLAVDTSVKGKGIGEDLLMHAFENARRVHEFSGLFAVIVDAKNKRAKQFYKKYSFQEYQDDSLKLFILMDTILKL